jgi:hypothetical protein
MKNAKAFDRLVSENLPTNATSTKYEQTAKKIPPFSGGILWILL